MLLLETVKVGLFMKHVYNWAYIQCSAKGWYTEYTVPHEPHILRFIFFYFYHRPIFSKLTKKCLRIICPYQLHYLLLPLCIIFCTIAFALNMHSYTIILLLKCYAFFSSTYCYVLFHQMMALYFFIYVRFSWIVFNVLYPRANIQKYAVWDITWMSADWWHSF